MIRDRLQRILAIGSLNLGEINARRITDISFIVRHRQDAEPREGPSLRIYTEPAAARDLARFDREGRFRPLKGAPTLPAGWELRLDSIDSLKLAIDYFYPGALASWFAREDRRINPVDLRTTLNRQTGMYRVTQKLTNAEADELNWPVDSAVPTEVACGQFCGRSPGNVQTEICRKQNSRSATISSGSTTRQSRFFVSKLAISSLRKPERPSNNAQHDRISLPEFGNNGLRRICGRSICGR